MSARYKPDRTKRTSTLRDGLSRRTVVSGIGAVAIGTMPALSRASLAAALPAFDENDLRFVLLRPQNMLPDIVLFRLEGGARHLSALKGKPILLNFWASWCALCRTELPMLDALQKTHGSDLSVLAISVDHDEPIKLERFAKSLHLSRLPLFRDPSGYVAHTSAENPHGAPFVLYGMPITYCVGSSGTTAGYVSGAANWTGRDGERLIDYLKSA